MSKQFMSQFEIKQTGLIVHQMRGPKRRTPGGGTPEKGCLFLRSQCVQMHVDLSHRYYDYGMLLILGLLGGENRHNVLVVLTCRYPGT